MTAWDKVIGHDWALQHLQTALENGRVGHAYLFTGPSQIGKTTLARTFAQAINCEEINPQERPCGRCRTCKLIELDRHPDVRLIQGELSSRGKNTIKIDHIRELQQELNLTPTEARFKIAILKQFDSANANAANAFLKTLEEPPTKVKLLLTAQSADAILTTVSSRCRIINLRPIETQTIQASLQKMFVIPEERASLLAHLSDGRIGWAIQNAEENEILDKRRQYFQFLKQALTQNRIGRFTIADELAGNAAELPVIIRTWIGFWRDILLLINLDSDSDSISNVDSRSWLKKVAESITNEQVTSSIENSDKALWQLDHNINTKLVVENLLLNYPYLDEKSI